MCGFTLFDTQKIIEKFRMGEKDYVRHAIEIFIDFWILFKRILLILINKEKQNKNNNSQIYKEKLNKNNGKKSN